MISHFAIRPGPALLAGLALIGWAEAGSAQSFDLVGPRARAMGGAFVAVADDATATWWNPAGLPGTLILDGVVAWRESEVADRAEAPQGPSPGARDEALGFAFSFPAAGVSYYRTRVSEVGQPATGAVQPGRQDQRIDPVARSLLSHHLGVSVAQSLGDAIVVGATARLIVGEVAFTDQASGGTTDAALDAVDAAEGVSTTRGDVDAGVLIRLGRVRVGLAARNLAAPTFDGPAGREWQLERRVRLGVALVADADRAGRQTWLVAVDADLTDETTLAGERRMIGAGTERWWFGRRLGIRGGVRASTIGPARTTVSGGASVAVVGGTWLEVEASGGSNDADRGWGLAAHVMF